MSTESAPTSSSAAPTAAAAAATPELSTHGRDLLVGALSAPSATFEQEPSMSLSLDAAAAANHQPPASTADASTHSSSFTPPNDDDATATAAAAAITDDIDSPDAFSSSAIDSPTLATSTVVHEVHWEGYVRKKGDWLPRWEERYLVLDGAALTYYNTKDEARSARNLRGRMILSKVRPEHYGKAHGFLIETKGHKHFHLCCTTELEKDMWVEMMQAAIDAAEHQTQTQTPTTTSSPAMPQQPPTPTQVDLRSFYYAFRQLLISHASSPQFFPKLSRDVVLTSNYAPTVPFWGEYHGLDGVLHFFSILYETVEFTAFFVTDIAQATEGSTAVVAGRETMKNRDNGRKFTQQWQHTIEFAPDGRVKSLTIHADPVAASAVFGCNATSSLSLPMAAVVGNSSQDNPPGRLHVVVFRGEQLSSLGGNATDAIDAIDATDSDAQVATSPALPPRRLFLGLRLITDGKTNVYAPSSSASCVARTRVCEPSEVPDPKWHSQHVLPFSGSSRGKPCFMLIEAWEVNDEDAMEEVIGVAKVNLAPFLALASSSRTVRESVVHSDIARGAVPQWYTLLSAHETKFSCGRVQLSISFEAQTTSNGSSSRFHSSTASPDALTLAADAPTPLVRPASSTLVTTSSSSSLSNAPLSQVALAKGYSFRDVKRDNHQFRVGNTNFDVPKRYQMIKAVGQGAYGCVIAASDMETGQAIAIKNVPNAFNDLIDAKRILREIRLMRHLNHPNLVNLVDLVRPPSLHEFNDVYIVTDLMETDLHRVIHSNQSITDDHVQYFLYQMLVSMHYVHSAQVLHRDLKPSNILVNSDCDLKLCDFGLARGVHGLDVGLTEYVVTRWYRAPELLLSSKYDKQMDVWAIGCILAEMLGRRPLFPGHDYLHQLKIIMDVIGSPAEDALDFITNPKAKRFILRQPKKPPVPLSSIYPRATPQCLDLLDKMLVFDPRKRMTIADALEHPYLALVRDKSLERTCPTPFDFAFEDFELTKPKLQELIFEDVCAFHPDAQVLEMPPTSSSSSSNLLRTPSSSSSSMAASAAVQTLPPPVPLASVPTATSTSTTHTHAVVSMAEQQQQQQPALNVFETLVNGKPPRPAPVVLLPPANAAQHAHAPSSDVAIDIVASPHVGIAAAASAAGDQSLDAIGRTSIHNVAPASTSSTSSASASGGGGNGTEIDLSTTSPHKLSQSKQQQQQQQAALLTPSSIV